jgi:maleylacetate reductase
MLLCLWHDIRTTQGLDPHRGGRHQDPSHWPADAANHIRMLAVPTMFSGAEFTYYAGVTDPTRLVKESFSHPLFVPQVVVLDPRATLASPISNLQAPPLADAAATSALKLLHASLPRLGGASDDLQLRMDCQFGMWLSIFGGTSGVPVGASHAIGHVIGGYGVPHGHTTGVCLPSVLRWNYDANPERQARAGEAIDISGDKFADAILAFATGLGVPTRLRDVGIRREQLDDIAVKSLRDPPMKTNPKPITSAAQVTEILELAW